MDGLEKLLAIEEIKKLEARRGRTLDAQDWPAYAALHVPDIPTELPGPDGQTGLERQVAWLRNELKDAVTIHHVHSPDIEFSAPDRAHAVWAMEAMTMWRRPASTLRRHGYGYYHVDYVRRDGVWKIADRRQVRVRVDTSETTIPE